MTTHESNNHVTARFATFQDFLDNYFYTKECILGFEKCYGRFFVSTGGAESTQVFSKMLELTPGHKVLDIGCGLGGAAFHMANQYGAHVVGVDMSRNMIDLASERLVESGAQNVTFMLADATKIDFPEGSFDVVYSRDSILHMEDPQQMYRHFYKWLKPGGKLLITNYCCRKEEEKSDAFKKLIKTWGYHLFPVDKNGVMISNAGFKMIESLDKTKLYLQYNRQDLNRMEIQKPEFVKDFKNGLGESCYEHMKSMWVEEIECCLNGDLRWGFFLAVKE